MSDEFKQKKLVKLAGKFVFFTGAIFVGVTLAILLSASILRPKHQPMYGPVPMGIERRLPPPPMPPHHFDVQRHHEQLDRRGHHPRAHRDFDVRPEVRHEVNADRAPIPPQKPELKK